MANFFGALNLTAGNRYGSTAHSANLQFDTDSFSLECWSKSASAGHLVNKYNNSTLKGYKLELLSDGTAKATLNSTAVTAGSSLLNNAWHHLQLCVDRTANLATLYADGAGGTAVDISSLGSLTNTTAFVFGIDPTLVTYYAGSIAEIRLSAGVRSSANFTTEVSKYPDDADTRLLYHFWEGKGATIYDMSAANVDVYDAGTRYDATLVGGTGTWAFGPLLMNHVDIVEAAIWAAIDTYSSLTTWGNSIKLKRHRARRGDPATGRQQFRGLSRDDAPGLFVLAQVGPIVPVTHEFHDCAVPFIIEGAIFNATKENLNDFWWLVFRALNSRETTDAGHFYHQQVQNWEFRTTPRFQLPEAGDSGYMGRFAWGGQFIVRSDFRTAGYP